MWASVAVWPRLQIKVQWLSCIGFVALQHDLPRPGIDPMSPALAGGFFTTQQPGEPFPFFKIFCFWVGTIFKVFIEFVTILLVFYMGFFFFFGHDKACGIFVPQPGIELTLPAVEDEVLFTGLPGKSLLFPFCFSQNYP